MRSSFWRRALVAGGRHAMARGLNAQNYNMDRNGEAWLIERLGKSITSAVDVGANGGEWSETVLKHAPSARLVSVEPIPSFAENVRKRLGDRAVVEGVALSDRTGEVTIYQAGGGGSAVPMTAKAVIPHSVRMTTGDNLVAEHGLSPLSLIKVDTDGFDMPVLRGFTKSAREQRPVFQFEYSRLWVNTRHFLKDAFEHFDDLGYDVGRLLPHDVDFRQYNVAMEVFMTNNFVAIPREKRGLLD